MPLYACLEKCNEYIYIYFMCGPPLDSKKCLNVTVKHHMHTVRVHHAIPYGYPSVHGRILINER